MTKAKTAATHLRCRKANDPATGDVTVVIESPRGSPHKYTYDQEIGAFRMAAILHCKGPSAHITRAAGCALLFSVTLLVAPEASAAGGWRRQPEATLSDLPVSHPKRSCAD